MSSYDWDRAPERLIHGKFGKLLRDANRELATELDQRAAFRRINERLAQTRRLSSVRWLLPAAPVTAAALVALLLFAHKHRSDSTPELVAERFRSDDKTHAKAPAEAAAPATRTEEASLPRTDQEPEPRGPKRNAARTSLRNSVAIPTEPPQPAPATTNPPSPASVPDVPRPGDLPPPAEAPSEAPDCLSIARRGETRAAEACFLERAHGSGLEAEMALYEVARLRRDVLADANGALSALAEYRKRFPAGSLRREADMSQLELLLQLGRSDEALKQSDELLASSASGERATELRLLRGHILRKQSRFDAAAREYELAGGAGKRGSEATYFRGVCLDALGREAEAAALFTEYLAQPGRPYAGDARRRLERLKP